MRTRTVFLLIVVENLLATAIIASGVILPIAHVAASIMVSLEGGGAVYQGGYPRDFLSPFWQSIAWFGLPFSLVIQVACVSYAVQAISARLARRTRFRFQVWHRMFGFGVPLLLYVWAYDIVTCLWDSEAIQLTFLVLVWPFYCFVSSLLIARRCTILIRFPAFVTAGRSGLHAAPAGRL